MRIIENPQTIHQRCKACDILLEVEKSDVFRYHHFLSFHCVNCKRLNEVFEAPLNFHEIQ